MEVKQTFFSLLITSYFIAFGVMLGGSLIGGIGSFLVGQPPLTMIKRFADSLRIWALVAAIGGTFDTFYSLERGIFQGEIKDIIKQGLLIVFATGGMQTGLIIIKWITEEHV
ncbi:YtrH family sporulation protein [Ectobacillus panaciterrae]|uniref:YtrH family sporulation protein n=1 Tax=Ectobacillus panaciterrae TaxID=363872 RepID=UPI00040AB823|nr:YtrH family sporulation protein [Ectobacillus panaciterrae]